MCDFNLMKVKQPPQFHAWKNQVAIVRIFQLSTALLYVEFPLAHQLTHVQFQLVKIIKYQNSI